MADPTPVSPLRNEESATTREEMDFEDEHEQETGTVSPLGHETPTTTTSPPAARKSVSFQDPQPEQETAPPPKPPRPLSPQQQAENTLIEAFPSVDTKVVKAVLMASGGQIEPAFNALLGMSDPDFRPEEPAAPPSFPGRQPPPRQPPRPQQRAPMSQMEADELYARQLAEQYNESSYPTAGAPRGQSRYNQRSPSTRGPNQQQRPAEWYDEDPNERNFFDDDLPEIGRNIQQGFLDTQKKVNSWITNFKKKIDGEGSEDDEDLYSSSQAGSRSGTGNEQTIVGGRLGSRKDFGPSQSDQLRGIQKLGEAQQRRSTEANRYDADPQLLDPEEFERLELRDDDPSSPPPPMPPRTSSRQAPNPDLFKSSSVRPPQTGPVDEVEAAGDGSTQDPKAKKWQPLTSVAPHPDDEDPFSLGDDEDDAKEKGEDMRKVDSQRLKDAARNSISAEGAPADKPMLEEAGRTGSQNDEALKLLGAEGAEKKE